MRRDRIPPLVHVGYHKTASSWLQRIVFPDSPEFYCAATPHVSGTRMMEIFFSADSFAYDAEEARSFFRERFRGADGRVPVVSHERFSGSPFTGGHDSRLQAERLRDSIPDARILVVIRRQSDMLLSVYKQYIQAGGGASFPQFLKPREGAGAIASFRLEYLAYDRLISAYLSLFGPDSVLVLPYELLVRDRAEFLRAIGRFAGAAPEDPGPERRKVSRSAATLSLERRATRLFALTGLNPAPLFEIEGIRKRITRLSKRQGHRLPERIVSNVEIKWSEYALHRTVGVYRESNARTEALTGLDLTEYGYDVPVRADRDDGSSATPDRSQHTPG